MSILLAPCTIQNDPGLELNPMELNGLYEYLYDLGTMLQSDKCVDVFDDEFDDEFRPWPHLYKNKGRSKKFYKTVDRNLINDLLRIRLDPTREDAEKYNGIIQEVLHCFGFGIIDSLEYTMGLES